MGLLDSLFGKRQPESAQPELLVNAVRLEHVSYSVAYSILPHYAFGDMKKLEEIWSGRPGLFFYFMGCKMREVEPQDRDAVKYQSRRGDLDARREYFAIEYPIPAKVNMSSLSPDEIFSTGSNVVLAPHFSAIIRDRETAEVDYFVLGQAPLGGGTTLRMVTADGANCNLGPGPAPQFDEFLKSIVDRRRG
jgi:hypothetical protein